MALYFLFLGYAHFHKQQDFKQIREQYFRFAE